jgi:phasin family protein
MADSQSKIDVAAEKAFAEAAEKKTAATVAAKPAAAPTATPVAAPVAKVEAPAAKAVAAPKKAAPNKKVAAKKAVARKAVAKPAKKSAARKAPVKKPVVRAAAKTFKPINTITQLKDKIMATKTTDFTAKFQETAAEMQTRAKAAYDKGTELTADVTAFHKGNFDAIVESGKVLAATMQDLGRTAVEDAKVAAETVTADVKKMATVKSPTELFQLQGEIARRNIDTLVARTSKNAEVMMKLANDMFAPISSRASVAMERLKKAA